MEDHKRVIEGNRFVVIKYSANFCRPCKSPILLKRYEGIKEVYYEDIKFKEYILEENENIFEYEKINTVPTFKMYIDGEEKYEEKGLEGLERLIKRIEEIINF